MHEAPYRLIPLRARDGTIRAHAIVDDADYEWLSRHRWHLIAIRKGCEYARGGPDGRVYMHRLIAGLSRGDGLEVDHRDGNGLNNRRLNLRVVSHASNQQNRHTRTPALYSRYRGVTRALRNAPLGRSWVAFSRQNDRYVHLGYYAVELDAAATAAQWRYRNMPGTIEDESLLAHRVPPTPEHAMITRLRAKGAEIERRWKRGESMQTIADALGISRKSLSSTMTRLRATGYELPYRAPAVAQARRKSS